MALRVNSQQWLQKWGTNLNASGPYITAGVNRVSTAPGQSAAAAADRYIAGVTSSVDKWKNKVSAVSLQDWQSAMINKGIPRLSAGITQAQKTKSANIDTLLANVAAAQSAVASLPKGGIEQGIARATAFMRAMSQASGKR